MFTASTAFTRFNGPLLGWFIRRGCDQDTAEDLAQMVWVVVIRKQITDEVERRFCAYLFTTARQELRQHRQRARRFREGVAPTLAVFGTSTPHAACRYCGEPIQQYADYRSEGVCSMHYTRLRRGTDLAKPRARRWSDEEVQHVRVLLAAGQSGAEISRVTGMSNAHVSRIRNRQQRSVA